MLRSGHKRRRRERILAAARDIIAERGYEGLTMRDLAAASRVTVPTIYNLVGGKESVLFAAVEEQTARFVAGIETTRGASPAAAVVAVVESCVRELLRLPRYYRTLLMLLFTSEAARGVRRQVDGALRESLARAVEELASAGELAGWVDRAVLTERLRAHLAGTALQWASGAIGADALRAAALYDAASLLAGATRGESRRELERLARRSQGRVLPRRRASAPATGRASGRTR